MTSTQPNRLRVYAGMAGDLLGRPDHRPPLVLLPGLSFDRRIWQPVLNCLQELDPDRCILSLDLPGQGESPPQLPHSNQHVVQLLHHAIQEAGLSAPVVVGHSMSGGIASMYAACHPVAGVVNVDAVPVIAPFVRLIQSMIDTSTGAGVAATWAIMEQSFRTDLLPAPMRLLIAQSSHADDELILSYWHDLLDETPEQAEAVITAGMEAVADRAVPYLLICGSQPAPEVTERIATLEGGGATVEIWDGSGHFPHLAHPARFASRLAATGSRRPNTSHR